MGYIDGLKFVAKHWYHYFQMLPKRNKKKILDFKNRHAGQKIFCLGAGPSLKKENLSLLNNQVVIFTNSSYKLLNTVSPKTSYWLVQDTHRVKEFSDVDTSQFSATFKSFHTLNYLHPNLYESCIVLWPEIILKQRKFIPYPEVVCNRLSFSENLDTTIDLTGSSVIFSAIQLAYYLGSDKIALLGVDMYHSSDLKSAYFDYSPNRIYSEPATQEDYVSRRKPYFKFYRDFLSTKGIKLYNCTCETREDELDKLSLEDFVNL